MRLIDRFRTNTFLLTLRYMVLFFIALTVLLGFVNYATIQYLERETEEAIQADLDGLAELGRRTSPEAIAQVIGARIAADATGDGIYLLADKQFKPLVGNIPEWPPLTTLESGWVSFGIRTPDGGPTTALARLHTPGNDLWLLVGRQQPGVEALSELFNRTLFWGLGVTLALAFIAGLLMSGKVLQRVQAINATSRQIMTGDLSQRVQTLGTNDEFDELATNLNAMLDQMQALMESIQHISDNVAHDLRTPLTRLRGQLEMLQQRSENAATRAGIDACLEEADGLLATFSSLLSIARIESGASGDRSETISLSAIVRDACELYEAVAEDKGITLNADIADGQTIAGDRNLIFQAASNLLDNAIKYTPTGGHVSVSLQRHDDQILLCVADSGPGIPAEQREKVLKRFYRLDRSRSEPGSGLGLSLVQAIAQRHNALIELADNSPGLRLTMTFAAP